MISSEEAASLILERAFSPVAQSVELPSATGAVLWEDLRADRDFPPYNRVAMDGIALASAHWNPAHPRLQVQGIQASGANPLHTSAGGCIEIMTGASLPPQFDAVVRYEDVDIKEGVAEVAPGIRIEPYLNIHRQGSDNKAGEILLPKGTRLGAPQLGIAASVGASTLQVARTPKIALIATGDELVPVSQAPKPHQVRISNVYALQSCLHEAGYGGAALYHLPDEKEVIKGKISLLLEDYDVILLSGGVSKGKYDFIPEVLSDLGVEKVFHKVRQKPGKPLWFGTGNFADAPRAVFGLPGNPVSALVNCVKYILPFLHASCGLMAPPRLRLRLKDVVRVKGDVTHFVPVRWQNGPGNTRCRPVRGNGSGDLTSLGRTDGFVEIPAGEEVTLDKAWAYFPWRDI